MTEEEYHRQLDLMIERSLWDYGLGPLLLPASRRVSFSASLLHQGGAVIVACLASEAEPTSFMRNRGV